MPITPYLPHDHQFDPETRRVMGLAFEMTLGGLRLSDRTDPVVGLVIANRIIELAIDGGVLNADRLCEQALALLQAPLCGSASVRRPSTP